VCVCVKVGGEEGGRVIIKNDEERWKKRGR
jgi:hypothetical protein